MLQVQAKLDVVSACAELDVDVRTLPGSTVDDVDDELRTALGDVADEDSFACGSTKGEQAGSRSLP